MTLETTAQLTRFELKRSDARTFTGLASTWDLDEGGDLIVPGAYKRTLEEWAIRGRTIPLINQHNYFDARNAIGKMIKATETAEGLEATFQVVASPEGDEFLARIKDGVVDGLSIGYETRGWRDPVEEEKDRGVRRVLTDIELREVSLVIWGMNPNALIDTASVKSLEHALRSVKREKLTEDDKKTFRLLASRIGALLRPEPPGDKPADAKADESAPNPPVPPGDAPNGAPAAVPEPYEFSDALGQRLLGLKLDRTLFTIRTGVPLT